MTIDIRVIYCPVDEIISTPIEQQTYVIFEEPIEFELDEYVQDPECNYDLIYTWRYIDPTTETYSA